MALVTRSTAPLEPWKDPSAQPFLRIEGITKTFGKVYACDDISLDVYRGEFFALLGGSGSGKSTLLRILAGLETPDRGRVLIDGVDVTALPPYRRPVNMMFQSYALFPHMTVAQNIAFGLKQDGMSAGEIRDRVQQMLELVQMPQLGASVWPWRVHWPSSPNCCCWMNRWARWTSACANAPSSSWSTSRSVWGPRS